MAGKLVKAKSQELLDKIDSSNGFTSKVKKVFQGSPMMKKRRMQSVDTYYTAKCFGVPLIQLLPQPSSSDLRKFSLPVGSTMLTYKIPAIVTKTVKHIEQHGLNQEGIYRINGNAKLVERLRITFDEDGDADLTDVDIYSVGSLLKLFLRQLPTSVVPDKVIDKVVELQESVTGPYTQDIIDKLKAMMASLPKENYNLLKYLCRHLFLVSEHTNTNKMTSVSLSIVFGPNIFRCGGDMSDLKKQGFANAAFAQMIQHHKLIFGENEEDFLTELNINDDDVFLPAAKYAKKKRKPTIPIPYHEHKKQSSRNDTDKSSSRHGSHSWPSSPVHVMSPEIPMDPDEPLSPHERSIDEAIEEAEKKRVNEADSLTVTTTAPRVAKVMSDEITTRGASPYSWRSSPGTSPSTSPIMTPRTSQAYTTLLGHSIQDNLFQSPSTEEAHNHIQQTSSEETSVQPDTVNTETSVMEVPYEVLPSSSEGATTTTDPVKSTSSSNESVQLRETSFVRRNRTQRNRKSSVYGSDTSLEKEAGNDKDVVQLLTVVDVGQVDSQEGNMSDLKRKLDDEDKDQKEDKDDLPESTGVTSVKSIRNSLEMKGIIFQPFSKEMPIKSLLSKDKKSPDEKQIEEEEEEEEKSPSTSPRVETKVPPKVAKKPKQKPSNDQEEQIEPKKEIKYTEHDFDYVTRRHETLVHPTKQRVRGPPRAKPSKTSNSSITTSATDVTTVTHRKKPQFEESVTVSKGRREKSRSKAFSESTNVTDSPLTSVGEPLASVSSMSSVSQPLSLSSLSHDTSPSHVTVSPSHVTVSPSHVTVSPSHVTVSPSHVTVSPSHVTVSPSHVTVSPSHVSTSQSHVNTLSHVTSETASHITTTPMSSSTTAESHVIMLPSHVTVSSSHMIASSSVVSTTSSLAQAQVAIASGHVTTTSGHTITALSHVTTTSDHMNTSSDHVTATSSHVTTPSHVTLSSKQTMITDDPSPAQTCATSSHVITSPSHMTTSPSHMTTSLSHVITSLSYVTSPIHTNTVTVSSSLKKTTSLTKTFDLFPSHHVTHVPVAAASRQLLINLSPPHAQQIEPEEKTVIVPAGWTTDQNKQESHQDEQEMSYQELLDEARRLRTIVKTFEANFFAENGRKPNNEECAPVAKESAGLTALKNKIRVRRSSRDVLSKTAPPEVTTTADRDLSEQFASLSTAKLEDSLSPIFNESKKKDATIRRHRSLIVSSTQTKESPYHMILENIRTSLEEKRVKAGRPTDLRLMTTDQLLQEKHVVQKTLLQFERTHGRPQSSDSKAIMKPLYNQYREIKHLLSQKGSHRREELGETAGDSNLWYITQLHPTALSPTFGQEEQLSKMVVTPAKKDILRRIQLTSTPNPSTEPVIETAKGQRRRLESAANLSGDRQLSKQTRKLHSKSVSSSLVPNVYIDSSRWLSDDQLLTASVSELQQQLLLAHTRKSELRQQLRKFETEFEEKEKRPVQSNDKKIMYNEYTQYRNTKTRITQLNVLISQRGLQNTV